MPKRTRSYDDSLLEDLKDPEQAAAYLAASLDEPDDPDAETLFLVALKNVAIAHGMTDLARRTNLSRESLYRALSQNGDPKYSTLRLVLEAVGLRLAVHSNQRTKTQHAVMVHTWENVISCDAREWPSSDTTVRSKKPDAFRPGLPRRSTSGGAANSESWTQVILGQEDIIDDAACGSMGS